MKINTIKNTNFCGYKNILTSSLNDINQNSYSFICLELNNDNINDLDTWYEIQSKLMPNQEKTNFLVIHNLSVNKDILFIGNEKNNVNLNINNIKPKNEKTMLKTYSYIASLCKRLIYNPVYNEDKNLVNSFIHLCKNLNLIFSEKTAYHLANDALFKKYKPYQTAEIIRNVINKNMNSYFKL